MGRVGQATAQAAGDTWGHVASCFDSCGQLQFKLTNAACGEWSRIRSLSARAGNEPSEDFTITVCRHEVSWNALEAGYQRFIKKTSRKYNYTLLKNLFSAPDR